ncbi:MAG: oligosaccharide repeat unit polymerase [Parabacteroides sp.]|nr:oligosaccharide repeat unit polymerase [Parabacteroides sp.]
MRFFLLILFYVLDILLIYNLKLSDYEYSIFMCVNFILVLFQLYKVGKLSPFFLFMVTFCMLFIGGRFWGILLGNKENLFLFENIFTTYLVDINNRVDLIMYILSFVFFSTFGFLFCNKKKKSEEFNFEDEKYDDFLSSCFYIFAIIVLLYSLNSVYKAFLGGGYLSLYLDNQGYKYTGNNFFMTLNSIFFGIAMVYGKKRTKIKYFFLFLIEALLEILIGTRGQFGAILIFGIWMLSKNKNVNFTKILVLLGGAMFLLLFIFSFSIRAIDGGVEYADFFEILPGFLFTQGGSMIIFDISRDFNYPMIPYLNSVIPGVGRIYQFFTDTQLLPWDVSFATSFSYQVNSKMFLLGQGLGWTLLGDLYLYAGRIICFFLFFSFIFGYLCALLEKQAQTKAVFRIIQYTIFLPLMILPRSGLNTIIPLIIYTLFIYYIIAFLLRKYA